METERPWVHAGEGETIKDNSLRQPLKALFLTGHEVQLVCIVHGEANPEVNILLRLL